MDLAEILNHAYHSDGYIQQSGVGIEIEIEIEMKMKIKHGE